MRLCLKLSLVLVVSLFLMSNYKDDFLMNLKGGVQHNNRLDTLEELQSKLYVDAPPPKKRKSK